MTKKVIILPLVLIILALASYIFLQQRAVVDDSKIKLYGNVDIREAQLSFNSSEHIKQLFVQEGDHVIKGQLLATLHTEVLEAQLLQAQAQLFTNQKRRNKQSKG
jgi:HlyD family secretion protein